MGLEERSIYGFHLPVFLALPWSMWGRGGRGGKVGMKKRKALLSILLSSSLMTTTFMPAFPHAPRASPRQPGPSPGQLAGSPEPIGRGRGHEEAGAPEDQLGDRKRQDRRETHTCQGDCDAFILFHPLSLFLSLCFSAFKIGRASCRERVSSPV